MLNTMENRSLMVWLRIMTSGPIVVSVLEGENAVQRHRDLLGATNPANALAGTLRADYADSLTENGTHGCLIPSNLPLAKSLISLAKAKCARAPVNNFVNAACKRGIRARQNLYNAAPPDEQPLTGAFLFQPSRGHNVMTTRIALYSEQLVTPENVTTKDGKINLLDLNRQQMREFFKDLGEKPFRADQVMKWMYHYCCDNFDEMTDINKVLRGKLKEVAEIRAPEVVEEQRSSDGTIKWAIAVGDQHVETVYIPEDDRATLCVSSQVGCALECKFCPPPSRALTATCQDIGNYWPGVACGENRRRSKSHRSAPNH